jgi:hypothetical protein
MNCLPVNGAVDEEKVCATGVTDGKISGTKIKVTAGFSCQLSFRDCGGGKFLR